MTAQPGLVRGSRSRYQIVRRLGAGGMGTVFLALDRHRRPVALKVLHEHLRDDPVFRRRFTREVQVARRVNGPGTARVLDAAPDSRTPYLVTEYVPGDCLHDRVNDHGPLTDADLAALASGVAVALATIHGAGVVHRDLKPRNVMLSPDGPKVIDFGVAGAVDRETVLGFGTPGWLAPEQLAGQPGGTAADVYAWGLLVTWAGTGLHPARFRPDPDQLPVALRAVVHAALAVDPAGRPTASELVARCGGRGASPPGPYADDATRPTRSTRPTHQREWPPHSPRTGPTRTRPAQTWPGQPASGRPGSELPGSGLRQRPAAPAPHLPARRRRRISGRLVTLVLLTALLVAGWQLAGRYGLSGMIAGAGPSPSPSTGGEPGHGGPAGGQRAAAGNPAPAPAQPDKPDVKPVPPRGYAAAGSDTARDGGLAFTLTGMRCGLTELGTWPVTRTAKGRYCQVDLKVTNIGDHAGFVFAGSQQLVDAAGGEHGADEWAFVYAAGARAFTAPLDQGESVSGSLVFDVPADATFTGLTMHDTPLSRGTPITLR